MIALSDAANLRLASTAAGVAIIVVAGVVGCSALRQPERRWWVIAIGAALSAGFLYVGYTVIRSGNFMAYYN